MDIGTSEVTSFRLTLDAVRKKYFRLMEPERKVYYHFTDRVGLEGILKSGGLWAKHRKFMADKGEFEYPRGLINWCLDEFVRLNPTDSVLHNFCDLAKQNFQKFLKENGSASREFASCLTEHDDDCKHWNEYAESGKGFAIGLNLFKLVAVNEDRQNNGQPYLYFLPILYNPLKQPNMVLDVIEAGTDEINRVTEPISRRIFEETIVQIYILSDAIKALKFSEVKELRMLLDPMNGSLDFECRDIRHHESKNFTYVIHDLRNPATDLMPIVDIKLGPNSNFVTDSKYVSELLDRNGYTGVNRPSITKSRLDCYNFNEC